MKRRTALLGIAFTAIIAGLAGCSTSHHPINSTTATKNALTSSNTRTPVPFKREPSSAYAVKNLRSSKQTFPLFRGATSVWQAGSVPEDNKTIYCPLLVYTGVGTKTNSRKAFVGTWVENSESSAVSKKYNHQYPCPKNIGSLKITSISGHNGVVHFTSSSGTRGVFNLATHKWSFS